MAVVTSDFLAGMMTNFRVLFKTAFDAADIEANWRKLCTEFPSDTDLETYAWLGTVPKMREWTDVRVFKGLLKHDFSIRNKDFEATIEVDRNTIEDDKYGMITPRIKQLGDEAARYPDELVFNLLNDGATGAIGKAFDDEVFFYATREIGESGTINNIAAGTYGATSAKIRLGVAAAVLLIRSFKDDRGRYMNLVPDTLLCSPTMEIAIREALLPSIAGTVRPETAWVKNIVVSPYLTSGSNRDYYLVCTSKALKFIFFQNRKSAEFVSLDKPDSQDAFMRRHLYYGVDMRCNVGWGDPRYAVMIDTSD